MAFRPFGFAFEIRTPLDPTECKHRIRQCKQVWYDPDNGPRGFILGRFIWLWNSMVQGDGPMLVGWIHNDGTGCRIVGRSGSDINGILYLSCLALLFPITAVGLYRKDQLPMFMGIALGLSAVALIWLMWQASRERGAGLILTDFIDTAVGSTARHEFRR